MGITTTSAKQTFNLGKKLAAKLRGGEVLALTGPLGAGKTVFVKGLAEGLGVKQIITSPTFTLMKVYPLTYLATPKPRFIMPKLEERKKKGAKAGRPTDLHVPNKVEGPTYRPTQLVHLDCYRVNDPQAIADIGAPDYFGRPDTISVIEWAERIKPLLLRLRSSSYDLRASEDKSSSGGQALQTIKIGIKLKRGNKRKITIK